MDAHVTPSVRTTSRASRLCRARAAAWAAALAAMLLAVLSLAPAAAALDPEPVVAGTPQVSAGATHSMALRFDGTLWAWGDDTWVQLGIGAPGGEQPWMETSPVQVGKDDDWAVVDAGSYHTLALKGDGSLWYWGTNNYGQLGGWTFTKPLYDPMTGPAGPWVAIGAGDRHSVAIKADGSLWTCGTNDVGQLGRVSVDPSTQYAWGQVGEGTDWVAVSAGAAFNLALQKDGTLWAWGDNSDGQLGIGTLVVAYVNDPTRVGNASDWIAASAGADHSLGLRSTETLWSWGDNSWGQLGDGTMNDQMEPKRIAEAYSWSRASAGTNFSAGVRIDGALFTWGLNDHGQLGDHSAEPYRTSPVNVGLEASNPWSTASAGGAHLLTLNANGGAWACGANATGQLGQGTTTDSTTFLEVMPLTVRVLVSAASGALLQSGTGHVAWTTNGPVSTGAFDVYAYDGGSGYYIHQSVPVDGTASYAVDVPLSSVPVGGPYTFFVAYIPTTGERCVAWAADTFTVYAQPIVTVTAPTAVGSWPSGSTQTVSWSLSSAVPAGEFQVSLVNQTTSVWYVNRLVPAAAGQTLYATSVTAAVPAGSYKAAVYWRPNAGSPWAEKKKGAAFTVTPINITVPAAGAVWPTQATCTVSWNVSPAMAAGEFQISLVNQTTLTWYVNRIVAAVVGRTSYSVNVNTLVPPGSYKAAVYWRATAVSPWGATQKSAAFTIATLAISNPTAASSWPRLSTQTVDWTVTPGLSGGEFRVSLVSASSTWYINRTVPVVPGQTIYSTSIGVSVPAGTYRAAVYWKPAGSATWVLTPKSASFAVTP